MEKKNRSLVKKKKSVAPSEKSKVLEKLCSGEQLSVIKKLAKEGCVFVVLGSECADVGLFYKGLREIMQQPVFNGVCVYDAWYEFRHQWKRSVVTVSINDTNNVNIVDSIKKLQSTRTKTLYTFHYTEENSDSISVIDAKVAEAFSSGE